MRITYLAHSGFIVTTSEVVMVFDYYRDPSHALRKVLDEHPGLPVVFFVSHSHPDHYNPEIFNLAQNHKRVYILSNDVEARDTDSRLAIQGMSPGDRVDDILGGLTVQAYDSTDAGVSFVVTTREGKTVFHAGDLNNWHWNEESSPREVAEADAAFRKALGRIASEHPALDVAFFPVDVRQGRDFAVGATEFVEAIRVTDFFPMHFDGNYMVACDFGVYPFHTKVDTTFHCLHEPGESIALD
ncbi:MAG: MBL fold metallo-hydrolase [Bacteroides sp.]|nr:MBL fold metallo-hydrolase [Bacteroides sp.]MCM1095754.1 MBL fold metallo-hydrolase [Terasakiella sp.]